MFKKYRMSRKTHETIASIVKWQEEVFPDATLSKQLEKYRDERAEVVATTNRADLITELADMFIVGCNVSRFSSRAALECFEDVDFLLRAHGVSAHKFQRAVDKKMEVNRRRNWDSLGGKYQHKETASDK